MAHSVDGQSSLGAVDRGLWWLGWRPVLGVGGGAAVGLVLGNALAIPIAALVGWQTLTSMGVFVAAGALVGAVGWYLGATRINDRYRRVLASFERGASTSDDATTYALVGDGDGSKPLLEAHERYDTTFLAVRDDALVVYRGRLDLVDRTPTIDDGVEIPYEHLGAVRVAGDELVVETADDAAQRYPAPGNPEAAFEDVRARLASEGDDVEPGPED
ncbi:MAG: hypothetical protein ABEJ59_01940 [Halanaeroarchaeum sp.]